MKKKGGIMTNLYWLYLLFVVTLIQICYLMYSGDNQSIFVFSIIIFISYLINPNMIFVLGISIVSINLLRYFRENTFEGMENNDEETDDKKKMDCKDFKIHINKKVNNALSNPTDIPKEAMPFFKNLKTQFVEADTDYDYYKYYVDKFNKIIDTSTIEWINENIYNSDEFSYIICNRKNTNRNMDEHIEKGLKKINPPISYNKEEFSNNIEEDTTDPNHINNVMDRLKKNTPELADSLKILNSIDINQVNSLINNLNSLSGSLKNSVE